MQPGAILQHQLRDNHALGDTSALTNNLHDPLVLQKIANTFVLGQSPFMKPEAIHGLEEQLCRHQDCTIVGTRAYLFKTARAQWSDTRKVVLAAQKLRDLLGRTHRAIDLPAKFAAEVHRDDTPVSGSS